MRRKELHTASSRRSSGRRWFGWALFLVVGLVIVTIGWLGYRANAALSKISEAPTDRGNGILPFLTERRKNQLAGEEDGRINVLLLGMGGKGHPGGQLTDTIMVLSIKPEDKQAALISIPRDLYVTIPGAGSGKLNSAHAVGEQKESGQGPTLAKATVSQVLGIPIHYYFRIDFEGFVDLVDALGGVQITVEKAISDPFYPDEQLVGYAPFYVKAGPAHMDGKLALKYARSRETTSDFDRSRRQQQLLSALKDKVLSVDTLANPKKLGDLLEIAGNHIRTDLAVWEMERFATILKDIDPTQAALEVLDTRADGPLTSRTDPRAGYIIVPRKGNFSELQRLARGIFNQEEIIPATIAIQNATGKPAIGGNLALVLRGNGYKVTEVTEASKPTARGSIIEKEPGNNPEVVEYLTKQFGYTSQPIGSSTKLTADILIVVGQDYLD